MAACGSIATSTPFLGTPSGSPRCGRSCRVGAEGGGVEGGGVEGGEVAEGHGWPDGGAGAGVRASHHGGGGVAGGVQAGDHRAVVTQHPGPGVGTQAALRAEVAGYDPDRVEGWLVERAETRVRLVPRIAVVAV